MSNNLNPPPPHLLNPGGKKTDSGDLGATRKWRALMLSIILRFA